MHVVQLMPLPLTVSCFSKIRIGFTFFGTGSPGYSRKKGPLNVCVCVCVLWPQAAIAVVVVCQWKSVGVSAIAGSTNGSRYLTQPPAPLHPSPHARYQFLNPHVFL